MLTNKHKRIYFINFHFVIYFFFSFTLYPARSRAASGNLVFRNSVPIFCRIFAAVCVEWRNSMLCFALIHSFDWESNPQPSVSLRHGGVTTNILCIKIYKKYQRTNINYICTIVAQ